MTNGMWPFELPAARIYTAGLSTGQIRGATDFYAFGLWVRICRIETVGGHRSMEIPAIAGVRIS
jgi:hypothetical protein